MQVSELMTTDPIVVARDETMATVVEVMQTMNIRHLPVVDEAGDLVGMISDRDVRALLLPIVRSPEKLERVQGNATAP